MSVEPPGAKETTSVTERSEKSVRHAGGGSKEPEQSTSCHQALHLTLARRKYASSAAHPSVFGSARPALTCGVSRGWMRVVPVL
jgi:hypothetical protein